MFMAMCAAAGFTLLGYLTIYYLHIYISTLYFIADIKHFYKAMQ